MLRNLKNLKDNSVSQHYSVFITLQYVFGKNLETNIYSNYKHFSRFLNKIQRISVLPH